MDMVIDTHSHTLVSGHAYSTMKEMAQAAADKGMEALAITEHAPEMPGTCGIFYFQNLKVVPRIQCGIKVLLGAELNIMDENGTVDLPEDLISKLDLVIASIHTPCYGLSKGEEKNTQAYINAMHNPHIHVIGHPDDGRFPVNMEALVKAAKETHTLLEVNNSSLRPGGFRQNTRENAKEMLDLCKQYDVCVTLGSDAHVDVDTGNFSHALKLIEECGFPKDLIVNTSLDKLAVFLK